MWSDLSVLSSTILFIAGMASGVILTWRLSRAGRDRRYKTEVKKSVPLHAHSANVTQEQGDQFDDKVALISTLSYEIRTPVTSILGYLDLLEEESWGRANSLELISTVKRNAQHLLEIINNLRDLARLGSGKIEVEMENFSTQRFFRDLEIWARIRDVQQKQHQLTIHVSPSMPAHLRGDLKILQNIVHQLVKSCWRDRQASSLHLDAGLTEKAGTPPKLQLKFRDNGRPLTDAQIRELNQAAQEVVNRLDSRDGQPMLYRSLGLGLNLSKMLLEGIGGKFVISSPGNSGNAYELSLPIEVLATTPVPNLSEKPSSSSGSSINKVEQSKSDTGLSGSWRTLQAGQANIRVLLVEDGMDNQRLIRHVLKKVGMEVDTAENGKIGLEKAMSAWKDDLHYDVILMDMHMPVMDGYAATRKLRENGYQWPVIALTAHAMKSDRDLCLSAGCDDYTTKPVKRAELVNLVRSHVKMRTSSSEATEKTVEQTSLPAVFGS